MFEYYSKGGKGQPLPLRQLGALIAFDTTCKTSLKAWTRFSETLHRWLRILSWSKIKTSLRCNNRQMVFADMRRI